MKNSYMEAASYFAGRLEAIRHELAQLSHEVRLKEEEMGKLRVVEEELIESIKRVKHKSELS